MKWLRRHKTNPSLAPAPPERLTRSAADDLVPGRVRYLARGRCPSVYRWTWCNAQAGHTGPHYARHIDPHHPRVEWTDEQSDVTVPASQEG